MRLSDKALRLISLRLLADRDNRDIQDDSIRPVTGQALTGYGRPRLPRAARLKATKAAVLVFRNNYKD